jgi:hypothetical protein
VSTEYLYINGLNLLKVTLISVHLATKQALTLAITRVSLNVSMFQRTANNAQQNEVHLPPCLSHCDGSGHTQSSDPFRHLPYFRGHL